MGERGMIRKIGLCREEKSLWERSAPLVPEDVRRLVHEHGFEVSVQPSALRIFPDNAYAAAGARIDDGVAACDLVMGMKGMPAETFQAGGAYMLFSQMSTSAEAPHSMAALRRLKSLGCTLIDYDRITDERGRKLVYMGRYTGLAGMIDTLWALGQRLRQEGYDTPFARVKPACQYDGLRAARAALISIGEELRDRRLPAVLRPMVFGFAGANTVSRGAQELFDLLPHREITPFELAAGTGLSDTGSELMKVVFQEEHTVRPRDENSPFVLNEFFRHPKRYTSDFVRYLDHLSVLVNCISRVPGSPRLMTKDDAVRMWGNDRRPRLSVIGDISGSINDSIEFVSVGTLPDAPVYVYEPQSDDIAYGVDGQGPVVISGADPACKLPKEASEGISKALIPFMEQLAHVDLDAPIEKSGLPAALRRAVVLWRGKGTPAYEQVYEILKKAMSGEDATEI